MVRVFAVFPVAGRGAKKMKASKLMDARKALIEKQGEEGAPVAEICRKAGIHWLAGE